MLRNYFCHLESGYGDSDLECPKCHKKWDVAWDTESGGPVGDSHEVSCPSCGAAFTFGVEINRPTYRVVG